MRNLIGIVAIEDDFKGANHAYWERNVKRKLS
jgi:hypothetical protein